MHDIDLHIEGKTFKNSSASNFETYPDAIDITFKNRNQCGIIVNFVDTKEVEEITKTKVLKKEECVKLSFKFDDFKNKHVNIYIDRVGQLHDLDYASILIPNAGHVKIFLNIN